VIDAEPQLPATEPDLLPSVSPDPTAPSPSPPDKISAPPSSSEEKPSKPAHSNVSALSPLDELGVHVPSSIRKPQVSKDGSGSEDDISEGFLSLDEHVAAPSRKEAPPSIVSSIVVEDVRRTKASDLHVETASSASVQNSVKTHATPNEVVSSSSQQTILISFQEAISSAHPSAVDPVLIPNDIDSSAVVSVTKLSPSCEDLDPSTSSVIKPAAQIHDVGSSTSPRSVVKPTLICDDLDSSSSVIKPSPVQGDTDSSIPIIIKPSPIHREVDPSASSVAKPVPTHVEEESSSVIKPVPVLVEEESSSVIKPVPIHVEVDSSASSVINPGPLHIEVNASASSVDKPDKVDSVRDPSIVVLSATISSTHVDSSPSSPQASVKSGATQQPVGSGRGEFRDSRDEINLLKAKLLQVEAQLLKSKISSAEQALAAHNQATEFSLRQESVSIPPSIDIGYSKPEPELAVQPIEIRSRFAMSSSNGTL
jgi:hypothetical protein